MVVFTSDEAVGVAPPGTADAGVRRRVADRAPADGFEQFYAGNYQGLATQLYVYTGDLALAQDLVQEAFCRALARWSKLADYDDPAAWVRRVAFNLANSRWRRAKVAMAFVRKHREQHVDGPGPDRVAAVAALAKLPAAQRKVMVLRYVADMSVADIAAAEGVPEGTVKSWLSRGRAALAALLGDAGEEGNHV